MLMDMLTRSPVIPQICSGGDGTGTEAMSACTCNLRTRHETAEVARSLCLS